MKVENINYQKLSEKDLFVCAIGYEPRSLSLLERNLVNRTFENTILFCLDKKHITPALEKEVINKQIKIIDCQYFDGQRVSSIIDNFISCGSFASSLNIDYSSMPRNWYCLLPSRLQKHSSAGKKVLFWYVPGEHISEKFPTAGIENIKYFKGKPHPSTDIQRYHIIGLGYDRLRSEAIYSIIEPENVIICFSYNPKNSKTHKEVIEKNRWLISNSINVIDFPMNDFSGMLSRLCGLSYSLLQQGQVIIVPDGPKPLIMAMSILSDALGDLGEKSNLTCLFIDRSKNFVPIEVTARKNEVFGFRLL